MALGWSKTLGWWGRRLAMMIATLVAITLISSFAPTHDATIAGSDAETMQSLSKLNEAFGISEASAKKKHGKKHKRVKQGSGGTSVSSFVE